MARFSVFLMTLLAGCIPTRTIIPKGVHSPFADYTSDLYGDNDMWLCKPDLPQNPCASADLTATEILPDGSTRRVPFQPAADPPLDCFYIYPTVDLDPNPGNHTSFADTAPMLKVTLSQAARFQEVCRLYAPLYRQITVGTYAAPQWTLDERLAVAYSDVADAFAHYLGQYNRGRGIVVLGHSQGAFMAAEVLRHFFDGDPFLEPRLVAGLVIVGRVETLPGELSGGTFSSLPVCTDPDEIGCVVTFRAYRDGANVAGDMHGPPAGRESTCTSLGPPGPDGRTPVAGSYFSTFGAGLSRRLDDIDTPYVFYQNLFSTQCVPGAGGFKHLSVALDRSPEDRRPLPFDLDEPRFEKTMMGLHTVEMGMLQRDLIQIVERKGKVFRAKKPTL
ncbi:MAG: DUF3089 domain-containing protein [Polyangiaceae bacterium]|nr:DUF3089 domain-containing protein [Polyangiaceae bacterium]